MTDLLRWLKALQWPKEPGTIIFLELALGFEEFSERMLPAAPQAQYMGPRTVFASMRTHVVIGSHTPAEVGQGGVAASCSTHDTVWGFDPTRRSSSMRRE